VLVQVFLDHYNHEFRKNTRGVSPEALARLLAYPWPGNIRELRNIVERAMILEDKEILDLADLPMNIRGGNGGEARPGTAAAAVPLGTMTLEEMERQAICMALERTNQNQVRAAKLLGISRDTLRYRMRKFGLINGETQV
jgi:transcriptional regulator with PAS, ATPase and Fis domain